MKRKQRSTPKASPTLSIRPLLLIIDASSTFAALFSLVLVITSPRLCRFGILALLTSKLATPAALDTHRGEALVVRIATGEVAVRQKLVNNVATCELKFLVVTHFALSRCSTRGSDLMLCKVEASCFCLACAYPLCLD